MRKFNFFLFVLSLLLAVSCSNVSDADSSVSVVLPGSSSRAAAPENLCSYTVAIYTDQNFNLMSLESGGSISLNDASLKYAGQYKTGVLPGSSIEFTDLNEGLYQVVAEAFDSLNATIAVGNTLVRVTEGQNTVAGISLRAVVETPETPVLPDIEISTVDDLSKIKLAENASRTFVLKNDLEVTGAWTIENGSEFFGIFDGQNHTITFSETTGYPLFWNIKAGSQIKNLRISGKFESSSNQAKFSPFTINNEENSNISNCSFEGTVNNPSGYSFVFGGGNGTIENCPNFSENISTEHTIYTVRYSFFPYSSGGDVTASTVDGLGELLSDFQARIESVSDATVYCANDSSYILDNMTIHTNDGSYLSVEGFYSYQSIYINDSGIWVNSVSSPISELPEADTQTDIKDIYVKLM